MSAFLSPRPSSPFSSLHPSPSPSPFHPCPRFLSHTPSLCFPARHRFSPPPLLPFTPSLFHTSPPFSSLLCSLSPFTCPLGLRYSPSPLALPPLACAARACTVNDTSGGLSWHDDIFGLDVSFGSTPTPLTQLHDLTDSIAPSVDPLLFSCGFPRLICPVD